MGRRLGEQAAVQAVWGVKSGNVEPRSFWRAAAKRETNLRFSAETEREWGRKKREKRKAMKSQPTPKYLR